jgi:hypothetical protein
MSTDDPDVARIKSDVDPDTCMVIVRASDLSIGIYGKGEFVIAGAGGGGYLPVEKKVKIWKLFSEIIDVMNTEAENDIYNK